MHQRLFKSQQTVEVLQQSKVSHIQRENTEGVYCWSNNLKYLTCGPWLLREGSVNGETVRLYSRLSRAH